MTTRSSSPSQRPQALRTLLHASRLNSRCGLIEIPLNPSRAHPAMFPPWNPIQQMMIYSPAVGLPVRCASCHGRKVALTDHIFDLVYVSISSNPPLLNL
eukprot:1478950-Heterocapsa_arctica.AAC.1